ncbi:unnamed protein product [Rhizophagus irregularis]|nr:unnamed protein product [Rhizophagus irregularis]
MERWTKGLCELPDKFLRTGLEGLCSNILNRNAGTNSQTGLWVEGIRERRKRKRKLRTKTKGEGEDEREGFSGLLDKLEFNISKVQRSLYI